MLKTGDIIYKVTLEGYDIPCVVVKKYKDEIVNAYIADDCEAIEQCIYDVTNIKVEEK